MAVLAICLVVFLAMTGSSSATYCVCNSGLSDSVLQKNIDYACGNGADCTQILQNGPCFNPNTVKDHCNYAVNSYYQRKGQIPGSCDFSGTAAPSPSAPSGQSSTCVYPSSASSGTTPPTTPGSAPGGGATGGGATTPGGAPGGGATGGGAQQEEERQEVPPEEGRQEEERQEVPPEEGRQEVPPEEGRHLVALRQQEESTMIVAPPGFYSKAVASSPSFYRFCFQALCG